MRDRPEPPKYHHYRPLEGDAKARPCLKCMVCLSPCRCDVEAEGRQRRKAEADRFASKASGSRSWRKSVSKYSWEDGRHADRPDDHVHVFISREDLGAVELKRHDVVVEFTPTSVAMEIRLPGDRVWEYRREPLYDEIDPGASTFYITAKRVVLKLAKVDKKKKWAGLTPVFAMVEHQQKDALDFGLAAMTGSTSHNTRKPRESQIITSTKREYWDGPPKYTWDKYDRAYQN
ncbi:CS domain-containing protein [Chloropicon primus]|nr:CS domain-containing protein [Chloropicon primus]